MSAAPLQILDLGGEILLFQRLIPAQQCQQVIATAEKVGFEDAQILMGTVDRSVRGGGLLRFDPQDPHQDMMRQILLQATQIIQIVLYQHYGIRFPEIENFSILRYRVGEGYRRHVDNLLLASRQMELAQGIPTRDVSLVGYLNEDFQGGETYFDRQGVKITPRTGDVVVFPAYYTHPHAALPVVQGTKYAFATWLFY
ncbi:MAG: prolyl hydroxylase family protein [Thermosynechococcus sp.]|uniref:prolyl hydroxylase family protein n=1 Tax=Thermosynechococcus sp. TaxID=2814275 RepID=UPI00391C6E77